MGQCFRRKTKWSGLDGCFPALTNSTAPFFSRSVDFCTLSTGVAAAPRLQPGENAYCGKGDVPQFGRERRSRRTAQKPVTTPVSSDPIAGKQIHVSAKRKSRRRGRPREMRGYSASSSGAAYEAGELPQECDASHYIHSHRFYPRFQTASGRHTHFPAWAGSRAFPATGIRSAAGGAAKLMPTILVEAQCGP